MGAVLVQSISCLPARKPAVLGSLSGSTENVCLFYEESGKVKGHTQPSVLSPTLSLAASEDEYHYKATVHAS